MMAAAAVVESSGPSEKRREIDALYGANNPEKLPDVDGLLAKYGEDRLLAMVRKKYNVGGAILPPPEPTGKAAAKALQQHIATHGTQDVEKIGRLRRASLAPDNAGGDQAAMMAAAAAAGASAPDPNGVEALPGETDAQYAARQVRAAFGVGLASVTAR
jgi:hypothetical protein